MKTKLQAFGFLLFFWIFFGRRISGILGFPLCTCRSQEFNARLPALNLSFMAFVSAEVKTKDCHRIGKGRGRGGGGGAGHGYFAYYSRPSSYRTLIGWKCSPWLRKCDSSCSPIIPSSSASAAAAAEASPSASPSSSSLRGCQINIYGYSLYLWLRLYNIHHPHI